MAYPDDYNTSAFPAGKRIAVSRTAGIWVMVSFLLIIFCCVALPWVQHARTVEPFVIYVDGPHGVWELIGRQSATQNMPYYVAVQQSLAGIFTEKWFTLSDDQAVNAQRWSDCDRETVCATRLESTLTGTQECDLYCMVGTDLYQNFKEKIMPIYQTAASFGERWYVNPMAISVVQNGNVTASGGNWIVNAHVRSNLNGDFDVVAYIKIGHDAEKYPQNFGYYVSEFNAYREQ